MEMELELLQKMVASISTQNAQKVPTPDQYYARDSIDRHRRLPRVQEYANSPVNEHKRARFQVDEKKYEARDESPLNQRRNNFDQARYSGSKERKYNARSFRNEEEIQPVKQVTKNRFNPKEAQEQLTATKKVQEKPGNLQTNILTWDQPYDKMKD